MIGWHHQLNGPGSEKTLGDSERLNTHTHAYSIFTECPLCARHYSNYEKEEQARQSKIPALQSLYCNMLGCSVMSSSLQPHGLQPARLLCPWDFSRQEHWHGLPFSSPEDLPTLGLNPGLPNYRQTVYHLSHQGSPMAGGGSKGRGYMYTYG